MDTNARELLYRSFDAALNDAEKARLDAALASSSELRSERDLIAALRRAAPHTAAPGFGPWFAQRVMAHVAAAQRESTLVSGLLTAFKPVAIAAAVALAILAPFAGGGLLESLSGREPSLTAAAQSAYALAMEDELCQRE